ncbi:MAG: hypothetical protein EOP11_08990 [Proteobacteria bacterium]|nr:MAG: hypothetical protein EOP11_08990 [Pseudomonadota bacterium]
MKHIILFSLALSMPAAAHARYCADPAKVAEQIQDCQDNERMSEAAVLCLEKFEKAINVATAAVNVGMAAKGAASKATQAGKQSNALADYQLSQAALAALIAEGQGAQEETAKFFDAVVWPEDADEPEIVGNDFEAFVNGEACYKDNRDVIGKVMSVFDNHLTQLIEAKDQSQALEAGSGKNEGKMGSLNGEAGNAGASSAADAKAKAGAKAPAISGEDKRGESGISGIKENEERKRKK